LRPETPEEGVTLAELFAGREVDIPSMLSHLKKAAADCGLPLGTREKTYNTRRAQEVRKWAESRNKGEEFHNAVFRAYFVDGLNIARIPVLVTLAESIGLEGAEEVLAPEEPSKSRWTKTGDTPESAGLRPFRPLWPTGAGWSVPSLTRPWKN